MDRVATKRVANRGEAAREDEDGENDPTFYPIEGDPTFYPTEEKVGQDSLQALILELLRPLIERWYGVLGKPTFVGTDQFIYYKKSHPDCVVAPDIYVLPEVPPGRRVKSWKVWKTKIVPSFALEVVASADHEKDYRQAIERYRQLGVSELVIFDPDYELEEDRVRWQRYRKLKSRGFVRVEMSNGDRVKSHELGCFLRAVGEGDAVRLRLGTGRTGDELVLTAEEAERAAKEEERAAKEAERAAKEEERKAKEAERAAKEEERKAKEEERKAKEEERKAKEAALLRVAELEALLAKKGRPSR